jgi:high-affinity K+ transport system ATPase subunit B
MIPASLIVVLTITMAAGTKRMVERHVIVRNLRSLEALGAITDICSDKTGGCQSWSEFRTGMLTLSRHTHPRQDDRQEGLDSCLWHLLCR